MIKAIETTYRGYRFRSRTEARWAVFFDAAGIGFDYEREGVILDGERYLPDFWLPQAKAWLEVKGVEPTERERSLCRRLAVESGFACLLAVGPPSRDNAVYYLAPTVDPWPNDGTSPYCFSNEDPPGVSLILHEQSYWFKLIDPHPNHRPIEQAYAASASARFEFGESGPGVTKPRRTLADLQREARPGWIIDRRTRYGVL